MRRLGGRDQWLNEHRPCTMTARLAIAWHSANRAVIVHVLVVAARLCVFSASTNAGGHETRACADPCAVTVGHVRDRAQKAAVGRHMALEQDTDRKLSVRVSQHIGCTGYIVTCCAPRYAGSSADWARHDKGALAGERAPERERIGDDGSEHRASTRTRSRVLTASTLYVAPIDPSNGVWFACQCKALAIVVPALRSPPGQP